MSASTVRQAVYSWLNSQTTITALVSDIFPLKAPQGTTRPYLIYRRAKAGEAYQVSGSAGRAAAQFEFDCCADSYATADAVRNALAAAIDTLNTTSRVPVGSVTFYNATLEDEEDDLDEPVDGGDTGVFVMRLFVQFTVSEPANP